MQLLKVLLKTTKNFYRYFVNPCLLAFNGRIGSCKEFVGLKIYPYNLQEVIYLYVTFFDES